MKRMYLYVPFNHHFSTVFPNSIYRRPHIHPHIYPLPPPYYPYLNLLPITSLNPLNMTPLSEIEKQLVKKKDWLYTGEVDSKKRPLNSLLSTKDIDFEVADQFEPISSKQNSEIQRLTLQRLREGTFDNFSFNFTEEICVEEEEDVLDLDLVTLFNEIEGELIKISDFGSIGFLPDVKIKIKEEKKEGKVKEKKKKVKNLEKIKNVTVLK